MAEVPQGREVGTDMTVPLATDKTTAALKGTPSHLLRTCFIMFMKITYFVMLIFNFSLLFILMFEPHHAMLRDQSLQCWGHPRGC